MCVCVSLFAACLSLLYCQVLHVVVMFWIVLVFLCCHSVCVCACVCVCVSLITFCRHVGRFLAVCVVVCCPLWCLSLNPLKPCSKGLDRLGCLRDVSCWHGHGLSHCVRPALVCVIVVTCYVMLGRDKGSRPGHWWECWVGPTVSWTSRSSQ